MRLENPPPDLVNVIRRHLARAQDRFPIYPEWNRVERAEPQINRFLLVHQPMECVLAERHPKDFGHVRIFDPASLDEVVKKFVEVIEPLRVFGLAVLDSRRRPPFDNAFGFNISFGVAVTLQCLRQEHPAVVVELGAECFEPIFGCLSLTV